MALGDSSVEIGLFLTARPDNPASGRILEKVGMKFVRAEEKYGAMRHHYAMDLNPLQAQSSKKVAISSFKRQAPL